MTIKPKLSSSWSEELAIVTGASRGLGRHFATFLAEQGATVVLLARNEDALASVVTDIKALGGRAMALPFDLLADPLDELHSRIADLTSMRPSILINNAGIAAEGPATRVSSVDLERLMALNVVTPFRLSSLCAVRWMGYGTRGRIVNIASLASVTTAPGIAAYAMSKAALAHQTRCLAAEWAPYHIAVNALSPGYIETEMNAALWTEKRGKALIRKFPRQRLGQAEGLRSAFLTLCDPANAMITGQNIVIDDGQGLR